MTDIINYKQKYYKYKRKYYKLKYGINQSGGLHEDIEKLEQLEPFMEHDDEIMITPFDQDVDPAEEYIKMSELITRKLAVPSILVVDEMKDDDTEVDELEVIDVGAFGLARGVVMYDFDFGKGDFVAMEDKPDKTKILKIDTLDDFDNFTEKYGKLGVDGEGIKYIYIQWDKVEDDYKGIYVNRGLSDDRENSAFFNNNTYNSWWNFEFDVDGVVEFVEPVYKRFSGYEINKPFKGAMFRDFDFTPETYIDIYTEPNKDKILKIDDIKSFDKFTHKYGQIKTRNDKTYISIKWRDVAKDYKGLYIDENSDLHPVRYVKAYYDNKKYNSWWMHYKIKSGGVYVFEHNEKN